ncbi:DUF3617 domain-containing protein [Bradyrhizobium sp. TZ2]
MTRQLLSFGAALGVLALLSVSAAGAVELPVRKAGLWEMKVVRAGSPAPDMTMQQCTDETTDKDMSTAMSPMGKEMCSKQEIQKTATGYVTDSICGISGVTIASHAEINGDFNSAYTVKSTVRSERGPAGGTTTIEAKWLGACKADQKPGDIMMPGGMKMNIKDMQKLKDMIPKQPAK